MDVYTFCLAVSRFYSYLFSRLHIAVFLLEVCLCLVPNTSPQLMGKTAKMEKMLQVDWPFWPSIKHVNSNEKPKVFSSSQLPILYQLEARPNCLNFFPLLENLSAIRTSVFCRKRRQRGGQYIVYMKAIMINSTLKTSLKLKCRVLVTTEKQDERPQNFALPNYFAYMCPPKLKILTMAPC